jgi:hypothetical protein
MICCNCDGLEHHATIYLNFEISWKHGVSGFRCDEVIMLLSCAVELIYLAYLQRQSMS